jgi:hypothetical protein
MLREVRMKTRIAAAHFIFLPINSGYIAPAPTLFYMRNVAAHLAESSQSITERRRRLSPEDNNERQAVHDHESVALTEGR